MANVTINDLTGKTTPVSTDELEIQETGGGTSKKSTLANLTKGLSVASGSAQGVMSAADKTKLDDIESASTNNQTGTTYTIQSSDNGKVITFNNASSIAVTLPSDLSVDFQCTIVQIGAGVPTVTPDTGTSPMDTINGDVAGVSPSAQWKGVYLTQYSAGNWLAIL